MSPSSREREYARRRYEDWQKRLADKRGRQRRQRRRAAIAGGAAAAVLAVAGGVLWFTGGDDSGSSTTALESSATSAPGSAASSGPAASSAAGGTTVAPSGAISASPNAGPNPCPQPTLRADPNLRFPKAPDASLAQGKTWTMTIKTTCGDVVATIDGTKAPKAVANAIFLTEKKYWAGAPCHRLGLGALKMLQCGDPTGTGSGDPGYQFGPVENKPADGVYKRGVLAMARATSEDSQGGQFFIVFGDTQLPGGYTVFGTVDKGLDVIDKVAAGGVARLGVDGGSGPPAREISIVSTTVTPA